MDSDLISEKSLNIGQNSVKSSSEYSCFGDLVWNFMGNQMTYSKNALERKRNSTVKSSVEISCLPIVEDSFDHFETRTEQPHEDPARTHSQIEAGSSSVAQATDSSVSGAITD